MTSAANRLGPSRPSFPLRMTARLALELFVLAVLITAACAWTALVLVEDTFRREVRDELHVMLDSAQRAVEARRAGLGQSLGRLVEALFSEPELLEGFFTEDRTLGPQAGRWMNQYRFDFLQVLNEEGKVLSSGHRPEEIGLLDADFRNVPEDRAVLARRIISGQERTLLLLRRERRHGLRTLVLVGGVGFDPAFVEQIAGHEGAVLVTETEDGELRTLRSERAATLDESELSGLVTGERQGPSKVLDGSGSPWLVDLLPLATDEDQTRAWLSVAVALERMEALRRQLLEAFVLLGCGVGLLAAIAGVWIARRTSRPVRELIGAFDAIARGEADYSFDIRARDEMQEVVASFSHLHRALEDQRRRSMATERVAAWREVARHVAHEVKNPLAPIRLTVENLLRARTQAPERFDAMFREGMQTILEEVQQLSRMVSEFAEFARLPLPALRSVALDDLIDRVVELYASEPDVTIHKELADGLPSVELDPDQVSRALKNVVGNAIEAARDARQDDRAEVVIRARVADDLAQIEVLDNGPGFSREAERRLFEPYFTTKAYGVGLGMALTYRIVIEHGGVIFAENRPGAGARVVIRLPIRSDEPNDARARAEDLA